MAGPLVSVIIPTFNGGDFLMEAITSVFRDDYPLKEIVVVDDGSTDSTPDRVAALGGPVRLLRQRNLGVAVARNAAIRASRGELIALLDHDDLWTPGKLAAQVAFFESHPKTGALFSAIEFFESGTGRVTARYFPGETVTFHELLGHKVLPVQTLVMRRDIVQMLGGFDESLPLTCDWDLCVRLALRHPVHGLAATHGRVRIHAGQQGRNAKGMYLQQMEVVTRNERAHQNCQACRNAACYSRGFIREDYYAKLKGEARLNLRAGHWISATKSLIKAAVHNPIAVPRVIGRYLGIEVANG